MEINNHYNSKLEQFGKDDFRSLNWGDKEGKSAKARYQQMFDQYNWLDKKVLEVGCGWGSFFDFGFTCKDYYGIDINPNLINLLGLSVFNFLCSDGSLGKRFNISCFIFLEDSSLPL